MADQCQQITHLMAQEPSEGCLVRHICGRRAACSFGDVEENGSPLIEVKVLSLSIVSLSSFLAMKMIWWVDF
jgi:hypothetical protein